MHFFSIVIGNMTIFINIFNTGDGIYEDDKSKKLLSDQNCDGQMTQYIVTNCDLVRVRYMLVYAKQPASMRFPTTNVNRNGTVILSIHVVRCMWSHIIGQFKLKTV